jgi:hypothetical protein
MDGENPRLLLKMTTARLLRIASLLSGPSRPDLLEISGTLRRNNNLERVQFMWQFATPLAVERNASRREISPRLALFCGGLESATNDSEFAQGLPGGGEENKTLRRAMPLCPGELVTAPCRINS